jgi:predicted Ser/Thr protein kinase
MILAKRYRIVGLLGRGGMGEVYRAEDLKLGQPVAIKFLPEEFQHDQRRLERFLNEVKVALKVTHPNVCRVYDIGEADGQHYISMEYVDGEDLASLLRRIGRLPGDRAVQVARQLCAGLAAAHEQGILHRDLKPANVMIDGRGRAKIADFGLASLAESIDGDEARAGTPGYMAPEQLDGKGVTVRSDLYALGLVLYELFTGKQAFEAATLGDLRRLHGESTPTNPSSHVDGLDSAVERIILRCLATEPRDRPASALAVFSALPGGDPLAAALAAGETPSPEMVADAGEVGGLRPVFGVLLLVAIVVGLVAILFLEGRTNLIARVPLDSSPAELSVAARTIIGAAGWEEPPVDWVHGFAVDSDYLSWVKDEDPSPERWNLLGTVMPAPIYFWYRQSPDYLVPANFVGWVSESDPQSVLSGTVDVRLDPRGRLLRFQAVPPQFDESERSGEPSQGQESEPDWPSLFSRAGLDVATFTPAAPVWNPLIDCDARQAWTGYYPDQPESSIRVEVGTYRGRLVFFEVIPVWRIPKRMETDPEDLGARIGQFIALVLLVGVIIGASLLARRNVRLGRGDRKGALRLAAFYFLIRMVEDTLRANHVPTFDEAGLFWQTLRQSLLVSGLVWVMYLALEPYVRRLWPHTIISWSRLLDGRFRDPLLGQHLLIGAIAGPIVWLWWKVAELLRHAFDLPAAAPNIGSLASLGGLPRAAAGYLDVLSSGLGIPVGMTFFFLLLRVLLRRQWAASVAFATLFCVMSALGSPTPLIDGFAGLGFALIVLFIMIRLGLLAFMVTVMFSHWNSFVLTTDFSTWYTGRSLLAVLMFAALAVYGFWISLAGRPLFKDEILDS